MSSLWFCLCIHAVLERFNEAAAAQGNPRRVSTFADNLSILPGEPGFSAPLCASIGVLCADLLTVGLTAELTKSLAVPGQGVLVQQEELQRLQALGITLQKAGAEGAARGLTPWGCPLVTLPLCLRICAS